MSIGHGMSNVNRPTLAYLGLGIMGMPMTIRLLATGYRVHVWNRSAAKLAPALEKGAIACPTPADATRHADIVLMCLTDTKAVDEVVFGAHGVATVAGANKILVDHSSMRPDATRAFAERLKLANDMDWIDAPVSGGAPGADAGALAIMCGGRRWVMTLSIHSTVGMGASMAMSWRLMRSTTGPPTLMCKSEACASTAAFRIRLKTSMREF